MFINVQKKLKEKKVKSVFIAAFPPQQSKDKQATKINTKRLTTNSNDNDGNNYYQVDISIFKVQWCVTKIKIEKKTEIIREKKRERKTEKKSAREEKQPAKARSR